MTSPSVPEPHNHAARERVKKRPGHLSKVAGAGVGTGWIVVAQKFGLGEPWTLALEAAAPWIAVTIGAVLPFFTTIVLNKFDLRGLRRVLADAQAQALASPEGTQSRATAEANLEQIRQMINENISDTAQVFRRH